MRKKKAEFLSLCWVSAIALGSCCPWGLQQTLCRKGRGHEEKRKAAPFQSSFQSRLMPLAPKCPWQAAASSSSRPWRVSSHCHVFCSQTDYHRVTHPKPNNFLFPHPLLPPSVALHPQLPLYGPERAGTTTKVTTQCMTFRTGWTFPHLLTLLLLGTADILFWFGLFRVLFCLEFLLLKENS